MKTVLFLVFCYYYYYIYKTTNLNEIKQRANVMSIYSSIFLFFCGLILNYKFLYNHFAFTQIDTFFSMYIVIIFAAYLFMDCIIGFYNYHKSMCTLSGYFHHIVYIFVCIYIINVEKTYIVVIYMVDELPTIILNIGSFNKRYRNDYLFGISFFISRICYHCFLNILLFYKFHLYSQLLLGNLSLVLHIYWFNKWFTKYGINK